MAWPLSCIILQLILLLSSHNAALSNGNIPVGESLTATTNGSPWLSPSSDFAFGFHHVPKNDTSDDNPQFLLAIWYVKRPDTIVWYANGGNLVPLGSTVKVTVHEGLVLSDPEGTHLWTTFGELQLNSGDVVSFSSMNDTGNLVLVSANNDLAWESFDHPTDTLLPTQTMKFNGELVSRLSETNFNQGRFQLLLMSDGDLVLNSRDPISGFINGAYYASNTTEQANPVEGVMYDESGYVYLVRKNGSRYSILSPGKVLSAKGYYLRLTLNFDGVLTSYSIPRSSSNGTKWSAIQSLPDNICTPSASPTLGSGICGYNSLCSLGMDQRPTCKCPPYYSLLDPHDIYGSCKPDFELESCEGYAEGVANGVYTMMHLPDVNWPHSDYERLDPYTAEDCKNACLNDCFCVAAVFEDNSTHGFTGCWKKRGPLSNGRNDSTVVGTAWLKVGNANYSTYLSNPLLPPQRVKNKMNTLVLVLLGGSAFVNLCLLSTIGLGLFLRRHKKPLKQLVKGPNKILSGYGNPHSFTFLELYEATKGFKDELGRGAFGIVYKGMISTEDGPIDVAVKKLDRPFKDADKEFKTEVKGIGQTHHKNLVGLVGFCQEKEERVLVYEYMCNGTLADFLFGESKPRWSARIQVALGVARGLCYLHEECNTQVIHCDIKPQNILLDGNLNARIADFGLAKLLVLNQTHTNTVIRGTKGYVAPEWFRNTPITAMVDVYSYGVLLLEIVCCRKSVCIQVIEEEGAILTDWACDCYRRNTLDSLVYGEMEALSDMLQLERYVKVALWCIQEDPSLRPKMKKVLQMLEGFVEVPNPPTPTSFSLTVQD